MKRQRHVRPVSPAARWQWSQDHPDRHAAELLVGAFVILLFVAVFVLIPLIAAR